MRVAISAEAAGSSAVATIGRREMSSPAFAAASRMRDSGPTSVGAR
jgi:hypothetical protein